MSEAAVITIDGPSGSGKGTVSQRLAALLGWHYLDSGAIYRALAYAAEQAGYKPEQDKQQIVQLARELDLSFRPANSLISFDKLICRDMCLAIERQFDALDQVAAHKCLI